MKFNTRSAVIVNCLGLVLNSHITTLLFTKDDPMFIFTAALIVLNFSLIFLATTD